MFFLVKLFEYIQYFDAVADFYLTEPQKSG